MARGVIRLVHGLTKSTLITYFSGMKIDPKYVFLHAFFLICLSCSFQNMTKNTPFFSNFARFCTPKWCTRVQCLVLKNNPNYVIFWTSLIPPWHSSGPPQGWSLPISRSLSPPCLGPPSHMPITYQTSLHKRHNITNSLSSLICVRSTPYYKKANLTWTNEYWLRQPIADISILSCVL